MLLDLLGFEDWGFLGWGFKKENMFVPGFGICFKNGFWGFHVCSCGYGGCEATVGMDLAVFGSGGWKFCWFFQVCGYGGWWFVGSCGLMDSVRVLWMILDGLQCEWWWVLVFCWVCSGVCRCFFYGLWVMLADSNGEELMGRT